jgi:hypothetical protein
MSNICKPGRPLAADLLDVEVVDALDLGAREEERHEAGLSGFKS